MAATIEEWVEAYRVAWVERDPAAAAALFTDDATYRSNIFQEPHRGRQGIHEYWMGATADQSDVEVRMGRPFIDGERVTVEFWTNMKVAGDEVTLPGCLLLDFAADGRCRRLREYWHFQPGRFDPPPEFGA